MNQIDAMIRQDTIYDAKYDSDYNHIDDNCVAVISDSDSLREVEPVNMQIQFENTKKTFAELGSVCIIINKSLQTWC